MPLHFSIQEIASCFMVLFAIIDIFGSVPVIVSIKSKVGYLQAKKTTLVACAIMISFLFVGDKLLKLIGIDVYSFAVAGALVLFVIALEMILGIEINKIDEPHSASIIPLAFPLIAGAGALTAVLALKAEYHTENIIIAILLNMVVVYLVLRYSGKLEQILGQGVISIMKKVFGIILLAISIKLFTANITSLLEKVSP
ncbi:MULTISPECIES: MarC family protein [Apibacter]|uniref:MarC family protein n=1 Tax=Apibacter TaxID=1778601 RepID=UPI000CF881CB|nr:MULTISPECIES: MarC family protein [Apibacter]MCX8676747.1 MarC family protein [Apibacter sp. B3919]MXO24870.1 MarC family protein [Apibacter sp. B3924]MXO26114.1 MarC family protein [Apibacter sp. B3813]MXO28065.1 MarC family protein [Apibacter sp. B3913]MXO29575.1 MarC family protein [Apibacter sp. B3912]